MPHNTRLKPILWVAALLCCCRLGFGQVISTNHSLNANAQLILHLDGLESSWEVVHARAMAPNKAMVGPGQVLELPSDAVLEKEMQLMLGEVNVAVGQRVKDFIQLFGRNRRRSTEAMLGVASIYAPVIDRKVSEMHMPRVLGLLPAALSAFHLRAISEDGNAGLWQLNYYVATQQGLICDATVDERRDLYKSTKAALGYLSELQKIYGNWTLALAAYTCGPAGITRARHRAGMNASFEQLYPYLPEQGRDYVPAFAAVAYVMTHAKQLGLQPLAMEAMPLPDRIQLEEPLRFAHVAHALGIPEDELRNLNPVCRTEIIPGINIPVQLCLPQGYGLRFAAMKDSIYTLQMRMDANAKKSEPKADATSGETNEAPKPKPPVVITPPKPYAPPAGSVPLQYTIKSGDNVGLIAQWYGIATKDLKEMNHLPNDNIKAGEKLVVYVPKASVAKLGKVDSMTFEEKQAMVGKTVTVTPAVVKAPTTPGTTIHVVKSGENLWVIAKKYPGVTAEDIMKANGVTPKLQPGMKLKIPKPTK